MPDLTLVVMAAGLGSRFGGAKQVAPIGPGGEITVAYSIYDALRAGFTTVAFIIRKDMEGVFRERVGRFVEKRAETRYVFQELDLLPPGFRPPPERRKPWGTGHAVLCCKEAVRGPFAVINADDFYGPAAFRLLAGELRDGRDYCMAGFILRNTLSPHGAVARGICAVDREGFLVDVVERTQIREFPDGVKYAEGGQWRSVSPDAVVSMNMWGFRPGIFAELEARFAEFLRREMQNAKAEFYIPSVVGDLVREGKARVKVLTTPDTWFGVTYKDDLPAVQRGVLDWIERGAYPRPLWPGP